MKSVCSALTILVLGLTALADDKTPPDGWKAYSPKDGSFTVFIPNQNGRTSERERTSTRKGVTLKSRVLSIAGAKLNATIVTVSFSKLPKDSTAAQRLEMSRDVLAKALGGEVSDETNIKLDDKWEGLEFQLKGGKASSRVRVYDVDGVNYSIAVTGTKEQLAGKTAETFFGSFKLGEKK